MRTSRIVGLLALIAGGAVGAVALLFAPRPAPPPVDLSGPAAPAARAGRLPPTGVAVPSPRADSERVPVADDAPADPDPGSGPSAKAPPRAATLAELQDFRAYVADTLAGLRTEEAGEKLRALEARAARLDEIVAELESRLELTPRQTDRLRSALLFRFDREAEYVRLWESGAEEATLSALKTSDREDHLAELATFLSPEQLERYLDP